jgi:hypothetical protein
VNFFSFMWESHWFGSWSPKFFLGSKVDWLRIVKQKMQSVNLRVSGISLRSVQNIPLISCFKGFSSKNILLCFKILNFSYDFDRQW